MLRRSNLYCNNMIEDEGIDIWGEGGLRERGRGGERGEGGMVRRGRREEGG